MGWQHRRAADRTITKTIPVCSHKYCRKHTFSERLFYSTYVGDVAPQYIRCKSKISCSKNNFAVP